MEIANAYGISASARLSGRSLTCKVKAKPTKEISTQTSPTRLHSGHHRFDQKISPQKSAKGERKYQQSNVHAIRSNLVMEEKAAKHLKEQNQRQSATRVNAATRIQHMKCCHHQHYGHILEFYLQPCVRYLRKSWWRSYRCRRTLKSVMVDFARIAREIEGRKIDSFSLLGKSFVWPTSPFISRSRLEHHTSALQECGSTTSLEHIEQDDDTNSQHLQAPIESELRRHYRIEKLQREMEWAMRTLQARKEYLARCKQATVHNPTADKFVTREEMTAVRDQRAESSQYLHTPPERDLRQGY